MRGIWFGGGSCGATGGVKLPDLSGVAVPGIGCANVFKTVAGPKTVRGAEGGEAALGADACASENEDAVGRRRCGFVL